MEIAGNSAHDYLPEAIERVKAKCLTVAQVLGDELMSQAVIVGGLVPTLLYLDAAPSAETGLHVGTLDLDLALDLVILDDERYEAISERLSRAKFSLDEKEDGRFRRQRWRSPNGILVDFLMPPVPPDNKGGRLQSLTQDLAAFTMRGLDMALTNPVPVALGGLDLAGRRVTRRILVCAPHVFVVLKALAIAGRDKHKDAYDIYFVLKNDEQEPSALGGLAATLSNRDVVTEAVHLIDRDFRTVDGRGPQDVCRFLDRAEDNDLAADVLAYGTAFVVGFREVAELGKS